MTNELNTVKSKYNELSSVIPNLKMDDVWDANSISVKAYTAQLNGAEATMEGYEQWCNETIKAQSKINSGMSAGSKIAKTFGKAIKSIAIIAAIQIAVSTITSLINSEKTLAEQANEANDELAKQKETLKEYTDKVQEQYDVLNDVTSSTEQIIDAKKNLFSIQKELIQTYGSEADGIINVTKELDKQKESIEAIQDIYSTSKSYENWYSNAFGIDEDNFWEDKVLRFLYNVGSLGGLLSGKSYDEDSGSYWSEKHLNTMLDKYEKFSSSITATTNNELNKIITSYKNVSFDEFGNIKFSGNVDDVQDSISRIKADLSDYPGYTDDFASSLSNVYSMAKKVSDEFKDTYNQYYQFQILTNEQYAGLYTKLESAQKAYEDAQVNGSDDATIQSLYQSYINAINEVTNSNIASPIKDWILEQFPSSKDYANVILNNIVDGIKENKQKGIGYYYLQTDGSKKQNPYSDQLSTKKAQLNSAKLQNNSPIVDKTKEIKALEKEIKELEQLSQEWETSADKAYNSFHDVFGELSTDAAIFVMQLMSVPTILEDVQGSTGFTELANSLQITEEQLTELLRLLGLLDNEESRINHVGRNVNVNDFSYIPDSSTREKLKQQEEKDVEKDVKNFVQYLKNSSLNGEQIFNTIFDNNSIADIESWDIEKWKSIWGTYSKQLQNVIDSTEPISLSDWLNKNSGEDDKTFKDLIDSWKSDVSTLQGLLESLNSGDTNINAGDIVGEFPDLQPYIDQYGDLNTAIEMYLNNSLQELINKFGDTDNIEGFEYEMQNLYNILNEGLGGSNDVDKRIESYEELIALRKRLNNGDKLSTEEMARLINKYDALQDAVKGQANAYTIEDDSLVDLINKYVDEANTAISSQLSATKTTIENTKKRIELYGLEIKQIQILIGIMNALGGNTPSADVLSQFGMDGDTYNRFKYLQSDGTIQKWIDSNKEYEELLTKLEDGLKTKDKYDDDNSSSKDSKETYDWIETAIQNLQDEISKLEEKGSSSFSSITEKQEAYAKAIEKTTELIKLQELARDEYQKKADSIGLSQEWIDKIKNGALKIEDVTDENLKEKINDYKTWWEKIKTLNEELDASQQKMWQEIDNRANVDVEYFDKLLDDEVISQQQHCDEMLKIYEKYYKKKNANAESSKNFLIKCLKEEREVIDGVGSAALYLLNKEKDDLGDQKDNAVKGYQDQIDALNIQIDLLNDQIPYWEEKKKAIQDELDAIEQENTDLELQKNLQKALYDQAKAYSQRTQYVYKDGQFVYERDETAIRDANDAVGDARLAITKNELQKQIDAYDDIINGINDQIDALNVQIDTINDLIDKSNEYYDGLIEKLEDYINMWQKAIDMEEYAKNFSSFEEFFGAGSVEELLKGDPTQVETWVNNLIGLKGALDLEENGNLSDVTSKLAEMAGLDPGQVQTLASAIKDSGINAELSKTNLGLMIEQLSGMEENTSESILNTQANLSTITDEANTALGIVSDLGGAINSLPDEKVVKIKIETEGSIPSTTIVGVGGTAHAEGTSNISNDETALVGEVAPEIIVNKKDSTWRLVGENGAEFTKIKKDEIVFNGEQTKSLLKNGYISGRGKAYASGTANKLPDNLVPVNSRNIEISSLLSSVNEINPILQKMNSNVDTITKNINYVNGGNKTQEVNQTFNISLPNVTDSTSAITLMKDLQSLSMKKMQFFNS